MFELDPWRDNLFVVLRLEKRSVPPGITSPSEEREEFPSLRTENLGASGASCWPNAFIF